MNWLIDHIKYWFCKHDWELISNDKVIVKHEWGGESVIYTETYRCRQCGHSKTYKLK